MALTTTTNVNYWPTESLILWPDAYDDRWVPADTIQRTHFYGLSAFAYESRYIGFLWIFRATDVDGYYIGPVFAEVVSSHDGVNWIREEGSWTPILPLGATGAWDDGQLYTVRAPVLDGDTLMLWYGGCDQVHGPAIKQTTCAIGLARLRKDGFASLEAAVTAGTILTKAFSGTGGVANGWTPYQRAPYPTNTVWSIQTTTPPTGSGLRYQQIANSNSAGGAGGRQDITGCVIGGTYTISGWMRGNSTANSTCTVKVSSTASTNWATAIHPIHLKPTPARIGFRSAAR